MAGQYLMPHKYHLVLHFWCTLSVRLPQPTVIFYSSCGTDLHRKLKIPWICFAHYVSILICWRMMLSMAHTIGTIFLLHHLGVKQCSTNPCKHVPCGEVGAPTCGMSGCHLATINATTTFSRKHELIVLQLGRIVPTTLSSSFFDVEQTPERSNWQTCYNNTGNATKQM